MAHFYGTIEGDRGQSTRCGTKNSGLTVHAASWSGAIRVMVYQDDAGRDCYRVDQVAWKGNGKEKQLAVGSFGDS